MTKREAAIVSAYTGYLIGDFYDFHAYVEEIVGRPIHIIELPFIEKELREKTKKDFCSIKLTDDDNTPKLPEWVYYFPKLNKDDIEFETIEKALGFRLYCWQKSYICGEGFRRMGKTTAEILKMLFDKEQFNDPIDFINPPRSTSTHIFRQQFRDIWEKLNASGIEMRPVFWSIEDKKKYKKESHPKVRLSSMYGEMLNEKRE